MLVSSGVAVAFFGAGETRYRAGLDHCADQSEIRLGLPGDDVAGGVAGIGAVGAEPNDAKHLVHVVLAQAGVAACCTAGGTVEALGDTAEASVEVKTDRTWMQLDDLLKGHRPSLTCLDRCLAVVPPVLLGDERRVHACMVEGDLAGRA